MEKNGNNGHTVEVHDELQYLNLIQHIITNGLYTHLQNENTIQKQRFKQLKANKETIELELVPSQYLVVKCDSIFVIKHFHYLQRRKHSFEA